MMRWIKNHIVLFVSTIFVIALLLPIGINALYLVSTDYEILYRPSEWTIFWGSYLGTIISAGVAFAILYIQRQDNERQNEKNRSDNEIENERNRADNEKQNKANRQLQLNIMKYQQQRHWLDNFTNVSLEFYNAFNHNDIIIITNIILNQPNEAFNMIKPLFDRIDYKCAKFSFIRKKDEQANKFANDIHQVYIAYRQALNDLQWIALYLKGIIDPNIINKVHFINYIQNQASINMNASHFTQRLYQSDGYGYEYFNNMLKMINTESSTFESTVRDKMYEYIQQEQERINNILTENLN